MNATKESPLNWDTVSNYQQKSNQPDLSLYEQKPAIKNGTEYENTIGIY